MGTAKSTPRRQLQTLFVTDARQRIVSTREPNPSPGPAFIFIRGDCDCAWASRADVPDPIASELDRLALEEPPSAEWERPLRHADRYEALLGGHIRSGPAFAFPEQLDDGGNVEAGQAVVIENEADLSHHFAGWVPGEIASGRAPVLAIREGGYALSVCFCARRSAAAAEAGIETARPYRGRGYAALVAIAWAKRIRADGLTPIYSTDWSNHASLAVARKLRLVPFVTDFSVESRGAEAR